jgi:hypothetical protein
VPNPALMRMQSTGGKTVAGINNGTTSTSNALPPVPASVPSISGIQLPPVPGDPFLMAPAQPVTVAAPVQGNQGVATQSAIAPASHPMDAGLDKAPVYQVECVIAGGNYCVFTNSFMVAHGTKCHCGQAAGSTE